MNEQDDFNQIRNNMYHDKSSRKPPNKFLISLSIVLIGLVMGYFSVYLSAMDVINHSEQVRYSYKAMLITPLCIVLGLYYMLCRPTGANAWKDMEPIDKPFFVIALVLAVASMGGLWYWFEQLLKQHGYA